MDSLANRLSSLPLILAGPILRRVTDKSVTVWVALQQSAKVTLEIRSGDPSAGGKIGGGTGETIAIGRYLHIVAVTAQVSLVPGIVYTYDMSFDLGPDKLPIPLLSAISLAADYSLISYSPYKLPSFSLPPADPNSLRIIHGSCRMPHGDGPDALSILDDLIRITVQNAAMRPHQLLLTGDQIYADDVGASLLMQLIDASKTLLGVDPAFPGWKSEEVFPVTPPFKSSDFPALTRTDLLGTGRGGAGFTSADRRSHLMSLGEYLCMYLFVWSDVLWPAKPMPTKDEVVAAAEPLITKPFDMRNYERIARFEKDVSKVDGDINDVKVFLKTLPRVRRALANIPTYMMCDDHDVTDDWNMTRAFCNRVYSNPVGLRVVQNALVAYALCQLWGNTPEQFGVDASNKPSAGRKLLNALDKMTSAGYDVSSPALQTIVGLHTADVLKQQTPDEGNFHDQRSYITVGGVLVCADSLDYNFTYKGPAHEIIFTDTRSWRSR
jgi:hypothetical protein